MDGTPVTYPSACCGHGLAGPVGRSCTERVVRLDMQLRYPRYDEAAKLRSEGLSIRAVAKRLNVPTTTAARWCKQAPVVSTGPREALKDNNGDTGTPLAEKTVDLTTTALVMQEIDRVYGDIAVYGYSSTAALRLKALSVKLDGLRRQSPPPCQDHISLEAGGKRINELVAVVMLELKTGPRYGEREHQQAVEDAMEKVFGRIRDGFNFKLETFQEADTRNGGALVTG